MVNILYQSWEAYTKAVRYLCRYTFSRLKFFLSASHPPAHAFKSNCYNTLTTLHSPCVTTSPYRKPFTPYRSTKRPPAPKSTSENVKDAGLDRLNTVLINFLISTGTTPIFLKKSWGHFLAVSTVPIWTLTGNSNPSEILSPHGNTTNLALKAKQEGLNCRLPCHSKTHLESMATRLRSYTARMLSG